MSECGGDKGALDGHTDEGQVDDLEQPRWDLGAKDDPAVVLVIAMKYEERWCRCERKHAQSEEATPPSIVGQPQRPQNLYTQSVRPVGVRGNGTNHNTQHEESARTEVTRKMCGFPGNIWNKESPAPVVDGRPEREESPVGSVQSGHECPDSVDL
jgi:hypothetical protein